MWRTIRAVAFAGASTGVLILVTLLLLEVWEQRIEARVTLLPDGTIVERLAAPTLSLDASHVIAALFGSVALGLLWVGIVVVPCLGLTRLCFAEPTAARVAAGVSVCALSAVAFSYFTTPGGAATPVLIFGLGAIIGLVAALVAELMLPPNNKLQRTRGVASESKDG